MDGSKRRKYYILQAAIVVLALAACAAVLAITGQFGTEHRARAALACATALLLGLDAVLAAELVRSLRKTLYLYKNVMLLSGILFCTTFAAEQLVFFLSPQSRDLVAMGDAYALALSFPEHFAGYAFVVILIVCLAVGVSNVVLMYKEGFRPKNALSAAMATLYMGATTVIYMVIDLLAREVGDDTPLRMFFNTSVPLFLLLMLCYFECVLAGSAVMGYLAARQKPEYDRDFIIILGCSIDKKGGLLPLLKGRVNRAVRFAWEQEIATGKPFWYVPSGGQGPNEVISEGSAMELYLLSHGAEQTEVFAEKRSRNTEENFAFSKEIIDRIKPGARIAFATTNYHMLRSGILARMAGIDAQGIAGDTRWYFWPNGFIREFFGILMLHLATHLRVAAALALLCAAAGLLPIIL